MIRRYDKQQARRMRMALVADDVYCIVADALRKMHPEKTPLNSVEIWMAAYELTRDLIQSPAPEEIFEDMLEDLDEQVSSFKIQDSSFKDEGDSVFLILMVSICQISALREQIKNADALLKRLMSVCRKNEMYFKVLEQFDGKEISMRMNSRKVDLLTYEMMEGDEDKEEKRKLLDVYVQTFMNLGPQEIKSNLLALNKFNLQNDHIYDDKILEIYKQLEKVEQQKGIEMTLGNKYVANPGGMQLNSDTPQDVAGLLEILKNQNLLGDGRR